MKRFAFLNLDPGLAGQEARQEKCFMVIVLPNLSLRLVGQEIRQDQHVPILIPLAVGP